MHARQIRCWNGSGRKLRPGMARGEGNPILIGALVVLVVGVIVGSLIMLARGPKSSTDTTEGYHFWCEETQQEVVLTTKDMEDERIKEDAEPVLTMGDYNRRVFNPKTGNKTLIQMWKCPKCDGYYIPDEWKNARGGRLPYPDPNVMRPICPHCKVDIAEWMKEHGSQRQ